MVLFKKILTGLLLVIGAQAAFGISATSWGDPEITTVDGHTYSFNGRGEYTFLETSNKSLQIQARTDFLIKGNKDATIFIAFVLADNLKDDTITIVYNKTDKALYLFQQDGSLWNNSTQHCTMPGRSKKGAFMWFCSPNGFGIHLTQNLNISEITFIGGNFMSVTVSSHGKKITGMSGLAGNLQDGNYVAKNGSGFSSNGSTERQLYYYAESWTISGNESKFDYNITGGTFTYWNGNKTEPNFIKDIAKAGDLEHLYSGFPEENITLFNQTCRNSWDNVPNIQCLVIIARTKDLSEGKAIMKTVEEKHHQYLILHNKPPSFNGTTFPKFLNVTYGRNISVILDLKQYVNDDFDKPDNMSYDVLTAFTNYTLENGVFNWTVGTSLRYSSNQLTFRVNDTLNTSASQSIDIYYCGCEQQTQCDFSALNGNSSAPYLKKAQCKCGQYSEGLYCEKQLDPCKDFNCSTICNGNFSHTLLTWPCAECPAGWRSQTISKHQTCENIDECSLSQKPCDQNCTDTDGSFTCHCDKGYEINPDGHTCDVTALNNHSQTEEVTHVSCSGSHWNINMDMDTLSLLYPGILPMNIFFGQTNCHGTLKGSVLWFKQSLHSCLTTEKVTGETVIYNNKIIYAILDPINRLIIRQHIWTFAVECDVIRAGSGSSHLHHNIETHTATATKQYNVSVELFSDQNFMQRVTTSKQDFHVGDEVYVKVSTTLTDWNVKMRLHTCYTKPSANATQNSDIILIQDGCEVESNTHIMSQSTHETKFVFQDFEYVTNDQGLYIFCNATFCDSRDYSPACVQSCRQSPIFVG